MFMMTAMTTRLVGRGELLKMLGVSPTRLVQLTTRPEYHFPAPLVELMSGKIWDLDAVEQWAEQRGRTLVPLDAE